MAPFDQSKSGMTSPMPVKLHQCKAGRCEWRIRLTIFGLWLERTSVSHNVSGVPFRISLTFILKLTQSPTVSYFLPSRKLFNSDTKSICQDLGTPSSVTFSWSYWTCSALHLRQRIWEGHWESDYHAKQFLSLSFCFIANQTCSWEGCITVDYPRKSTRWKISFLCCISM